MSSVRRPGLPGPPGFLSGFGFSSSSHALIDLVPESMPDSCAGSLTQP